MKPLESPITLGDTKREVPHLFAKFSLIGTLLWLIIRPTKWKAYCLSLQKQVEERGPIPPEVWDSNNQRIIASKIEEILCENWGLKMTFHPDDPYYVIAEFEVGDLSEFEAIMDIEDYFEITFPDDFFKIERTFRNVVNFIEEKSPVIKNVSGGVSKRNDPSGSFRNLGKMALWCRENKVVRERNGSGSLFAL